jgi:hypothetical protein
MASTIDAVFFRHTNTFEGYQSITLTGETGEKM